MPDTTLITGTPEEVLEKFETSADGLSGAEAEKRKGKYGPNTISQTERTWKTILLRQFTSSFVYLLIIVCLIYIFFGQFTDALMIFLFLAINTVLGFYQEYRSETTVKLLKNFIRAEETVVRGGKMVRIPVSELVPGDIVRVAAGDLLPADIRFVDSSGLAIDESVLTGESAPVDKRHEAVEDPQDPLNMGYSGTIVVSGKGTGVVVAIGGETKYADIARLVARTEKKTVFEKEIDAISKFTIVLVAVTLAFIFAMHMALNITEDLTELAIFSIALAVSVIPEALPLVMTFSLSIGAMRLAREKVVVKRLSAIEDLGSIEVLCSDKTGTLTENKLALDGWWGNDRDEVTRYEAYAIPETNGTHADPFDTAILSAFDAKPDYRLLASLPFDPEHKRTTALVEHDGIRELVTRGAPESVAALCMDVDSQEHRKIMDWISAVGTEGKRVLGVAKKRVDADLHNLRDGESDMEFVGMLSFVDPIKPTAHEAIAHAHELGIALKILTGDSREVAAAVAKQVGLITATTDVITGLEFEKLNGAEQRKAVEHYHVFARVTPPQKHLIVQLLEASHEVGFLGEGINDAPALKAANVAIAVAGAADIAREASDIVLMEKSLKAIVNGVRHGRSMFVNTTKYITSTLSANFGNFFAIVLVSLTLPYLPMLPLQILLLNLLSDFPMISVATDTVDKGEIRKPRRYNIRNFAVFALLLGAVSTFFDFLFFAVFVRQGQTILQTSWYIGSVLTELAFIYSVRTRKFMLFGSRPSAPLVLLSVVAAVLTVAIPYVPIGREVFMFEKPSAGNLMVIFGIVLLYILATEGMKRLYYGLRLDLKLAVGHNGAHVHHKKRI